MTEHIVWNMSAETACLFYDVCKELNAETEEQKTQILAALAQMGYMNSVSTTHRTKEQIIKDYAKHYNILRVKENEDGDAE